jgi:hypothetical protein
MDDSAIPLRDLLEKYVSHSYNELFKLLDENSGEESQKRALMRVLHWMYVLGTKWRMALIFNGKFQHSAEIVRYLRDSDQYESYLNDFANNLFNFRVQLEGSILSLYDVESAIDLLVGGCPSRLPLAIFPKPQKFSGDPAPFWELIGGILKAKFLSIRIPTHLRLKPSRGRMICLARNSYRLVLSIDREDGPILASQLTILRRPYFAARDEGHALQQMSCHGHDLHHELVVSEFFIHKLLLKINELLEKSPQPLMDVDGLLQKVLVILDFQRLKIEAKRIERGDPGRLKVCDTPTGPSVFTCTFWKSTIYVALSGTLLLYGIGKQTIGSAKGVKFDDILADCKKLEAIRRLKEFRDERIKAGTLETDGLIPRLVLHGQDIVVDKGSGHIVWANHRDIHLEMLDGDRLQRGMRREATDAEIGTRLEMPVEWPWTPFPPAAEGI